MGEMFQVQLLFQRLAISSTSPCIEHAGERRKAEEQLPPLL